jgi:bacillithiol system protein YtxJ
MMNWNLLTTETQEEQLRKESAQKPVVIFKHSNRCSISMMAKTRMEKLAGNEDAAFYLIDVVKDRPISMKVAEQYQVHHESPQALLIVNGECVFDESHNGITAEEIAEEIKRVSGK